MSQRQRTSLGAALAVLLAVGIGWSVVAAAVGGADREIVLEARGMAFFLPGDPTPNPTLHVTAGERVRLVLVNRDPGMRHDLTAPTLGVATPTLAGDGSSATVTLSVPAGAGEHAYVCSLHQQLMRGRLVIASPGS